MRLAVPVLGDVLDELVVVCVQVGAGGGGVVVLPSAAAKLPSARAADKSNDRVFFTLLSSAYRPNLSPL